MKNKKSTEPAGVIGSSLIGIQLIALLSASLVYGSDPELTAGGGAPR